MSDDDDIGTVRWFGDSWGAPINDPRARIETPAAEKCIDCSRWIMSDDQGVRLPSTDGFVFYHLACFLEDIGVMQGAEIFHD